MKRNVNIDEILKPLAETPLQAYLSNLLQVADVLEWVLAQTGRARIYQTSFSISEEFLRRLFFIYQKGNISEINLVLDHTATNKTLKLWAFITQVIERTYLADNHSKLLLVEPENANYVVSIITSQNLTRGNRLESTLISTDRNLFEKLRSEIDDIIKFHSIPLNELFRERIADD